MTPGDASSKTAHDGNEANPRSTGSSYIVKEIEMTLNLNRTLAWTQVVAAREPEDAQWLALLDDLQGNILKGHGRRHTANVFLRFAPRRVADAKAFLRGLGNDLTTALQQLIDTQVFKATGRPGGEFMAAFLTAPGYQALGLDDVMPGDPAFRAGMGTRALNDPPQSQWDGTFKREIHAMVMLAADGDDPKDTRPRDRMLDYFLQRVAATNDAVTVLGHDLGDQQFNKDDNGIEQFGYVDGRSQPLMLDEDIRKELPGGPKPGVWDPSIPLSQVLVVDKAGNLEVSCGSYFVYRKLEQNVRAFKKREALLGTANGGIGEQAGASVIGRFENGFPLLKRAVDSATGVPEGTVENDFDYSGDTSGLRCPYAAHIRKTNPRRADAQAHLMARRGITYGRRTDDLDGDDIDDKPTGDVGLLFMAYQSDLSQQFEFTQGSWANNPRFDFNAPQSIMPVGIDPVIGQPAGAGPQQFTEVWGKSLGPKSDFSGFVTLKGGAYFFAPAISTLVKLK
jgi:Dyp-type peroxidase family